MSNDCAHFQFLDELGNEILHFHIRGVCFVTNRIFQRVCVCVRERERERWRGGGQICEDPNVYNVCISSHTCPCSRAQPGRTRDRNTICDNHTTTISSV